EKILYAYTTNKDADSGLARINFCPSYFEPRTSTLPKIIKFMKKETLKSFKFDIDQYWASQAHIWIHELLHIDWVSQAMSYGSNEHITDMKIDFAQGKKMKETKAYGGRFTKILARFPRNTGRYVMKNADNLALYALAHYVQGQIDGYPLYPLVNDEASDDPHLFTTKDGKVQLNIESSEIATLPEAGAKWCDDDEDQPNEGTAVKVDAFAPDSAYPLEYLQLFGAPAPPAPKPADDKKDENKCHGVGGDTWVIHRDTAVKNAEDFCKQATKSLE
ncbi:MAG: hypothetical protein Q9224_007474, partial [Gallowayella concinna]